MPDNKPDAWEVVRALDFPCGGQVAVMQVCGRRGDLPVVGTVYALRSPDDKQDDAKRDRILRGRMDRLKNKGAHRFGHFGSELRLGELRKGRRPIRWLLPYSAINDMVYLDDGPLADLSSGLMELAAPCCQHCGVRNPEITVTLTTRLQQELLLSLSGTVAGVSCGAPELKWSEFLASCGHCGNRTAIRQRAVSAKKTSE